MYISVKDMKTRIDNINGAVIACAACANNPRKYAEFFEAEKALQLRIEEVFSILEISREFAPIVARLCYMRTIRLKSGEFEACSGSTFRKWFKNLLAEDFGYIPNKKERHHARTVKDGDTIRPMTAEEIATWQKNRLAKLQKQLADLQAEMAAC